MKRRDFINSLAAGGAASLSLAGTPEVLAQQDSLVRTPLVIMAPRNDGFEAVWAVSRLSRGRIEWESADGTKGSAGSDDFGFVPQGEQVLRVRVSGLKSGATYRVRSQTIAAADKETVWSDWKSFRTLDDRATETRFVMWNDTHVNNATIQALDAATPGADFLLWNGDTCNDWTAPDLLIPTLLHPGQRDISTNRPLFITWGNHDVRGAHAFRMPQIIATPDQRPYYAFRSGPVAFICLHTGEDKPDDHPSFQGRVAFDALRREQARWLSELIRKPGFRDAPYRVVFCHIPLRWKDESPQNYAATGFDRHSGRSRAAWNDSLVEWKTQIILSGHTHQPHWMPPSGEFPYGQLIGGGPQPERATWTEGQATSRELRFKMSDLKGKILHEIALTPLG